MTIYEAFGKDTTIVSDTERWSHVWNVCSRWKATEKTCNLTTIGMRLNLVHMAPGTPLLF